MPDKKKTAKAGRKAPGAAVKPSSRSAAAPSAAPRAKARPSAGGRAATPPAADAARKPGATRGRPPSPADKERIRKMLLAARDRLSEQVDTLKSQSLTREDSVYSAEDGTDAFDRQFSLNIASVENDSLMEIESALRRLAEGSYGACEECQSWIEKPRLEALPFVRTCIGCQSARERGKERFRREGPAATNES